MGIGQQLQANYDLAVKNGRDTKRIRETLIVWFGAVLKVNPGLRCIGY